MLETLLPTKIFAPPLRPSLVPRPHLIERLNRGLNGSLSLVSAPAGFGKTTLISTWLEQLSSNHKTTWLSLDESDNDPSRFFAYFVGALQMIHPTLGQGMASASQLPPIASAMQLLLHEITAVPQPFILVLDDYHLIARSDIHQATAVLLAYMPSHMHLVISSRADPPFPLSKLRVRRQLTEIRARDLRFTPAEASEFLNQTMGLSLTLEEVALLEKRTEGWIGGLQLAALSLQIETDKATFLTAFAGDDRYIADYLLEEVLTAQPEAIQSFLLQSSILKQLNSSLCNAVLERQDSQSVLEFLEQSNLFIVSLDQRRQWYRYHHLFADLLRDRLETLPGGARHLHQRASQWYADNQLMPEAVEHALAAGDFEGAIGLILLSAEEIFMSSRLLTLLEWCQKLPEELRTQNLTLSIMMAWAWLATGHHQESEQCLQVIERTLETTTQALLTDIDTMQEFVRNGLIEVAVIRMSYQSADPFDAPETLALCQRILPFLVVEETVFLFSPLYVLRPVVLFNLGMSYQTLGQLEAAAAAYVESKKQAQTLGNIHIVASALGHLAEVEIVRGRLHQAAQTCQRGLELLAVLAGKLSPMSGLLHVQLGNLYYEWNDLESAVNHFQEGISLAKTWQNREALLPGYEGLATAYIASGQYQAAQAAQKDFMEMLTAETTPADSPAMANIAWLQAQLGHTAPALRWADEAAFDMNEAIHEDAAIMRLRLRILQGKQAEIIPTLKTLLASAESGKRWGRVVALLVLQAVACAAQGDRKTAINSLARALKIAEPENYVRSFVDGGLPVALLLREGLENGWLPPYAQKLLAALEPTTQDTKPIEETASPNVPLIDPLSARELEVLQLINEGLTNKEIAARLHLSLGTVKVHAHNIYSKLDVNGRTQAIVKARALHILD